MISEFISNLQMELLTNRALEHAFRPAFKQLIEKLSPEIIAVNDPPRSLYGNPDFIFINRHNKDLILGYAETKDINVNLDVKEKSEQLKRYLGYSRLILTNNIEFRFFQNGEKYQTIQIASLQGNILQPMSINFPLLERELKAFLTGKPETITNAKRLAEIMGGKASRIRANINAYLGSESLQKVELLKMYDIMRKLLVHDLKPDKFADMYAQTLVYGLFVARYYDKTKGNFTRQEARDLVPASNPFLRHFFDHIVGPDFDKRLSHIVDELCEVFTVSDIPEIIQKHFNLFGEEIDKDPIIHFYEDFLIEYDADLRKDMGAFYTPVPVVNFILHAVDDILKKEFNLPDGLSSTDKFEKEWIVQGKKAKTKQVFHRVQILDPAVGTATFLNEIIKYVATKFRGQEGVWKSYVEKELLPRIHGFELMMAPYTIAHLKLAMTLKETGISDFNRRLGIYMTNTLEEGFKVTDSLLNFGLVDAITVEASEASRIKHETPIMVVIGNPPYKGISSNNTDYANSLVAKYKVEPGGLMKLQERKHWLNDDYVKFIAFAENMIEKNEEGIVAMITNHGYLDNPTFRGMRWHLTNTFNSIYIVDLHGNVMRKEKSPDGGKDENVFDIQQGVSIIVATKLKNKKKVVSKVFRTDVWGKRIQKYEKLLNGSLSTVDWQEIVLDPKTYSFSLNKNKEVKQEYYKGISVAELFPISVTGIVTARDKLVIDPDRKYLEQRIEYFFNSDYSDQEVRQKFFSKKKSGKYLPGDSRGWRLAETRKQMLNENHEKNILPIAYRPFDIQWIYYHPKMVDWGRENIMKNFIDKPNIGLIFTRQAITDYWSHIQISKNVIDNRILYSNKGIPSFAPLYIYENQMNTLNQNIRKSNIDKKLAEILIKNIGQYIWVDDEEEKTKDDLMKVSPRDILNYVYAALHSNKYREKFMDLLKEDYPRVPLVKNSEYFWKLVRIGDELINLHLLEGSTRQSFNTIYPVAGNNSIEDVRFSNSKIWINETQYIGNVEKKVWEYGVGGYQPAQQWFKYRKGRNLDYEDIVHYQKIIYALTKTITIVDEIDEIVHKSYNI